MLQNQPLTVEQRLTQRHLVTDLLNHLLFNMPKEYNSLSEPQRQQIVSAAFAHFKDSRVIQTFEAMLSQLVKENEALDEVVEKVQKSLK